MPKRSSATRGCVGVVGTALDLLRSQIPIRTERGSKYQGAQAGRFRGGEELIVVLADGTTRTIAAERLFFNLRGTVRVAVSADKTDRAKWLSTDIGGYLETFADHRETTTCPNSATCRASSSRADQSPLPRGCFGRSEPWLVLGTFSLPPEAMERVEAPAAPHGGVASAFVAGDVTVAMRDKQQRACLSDMRPTPMRLSAAVALEFRRATAAVVNLVCEQPRQRRQPGLQVSCRRPRQRPTLTRQRP